VRTPGERIGSDGVSQIRALLLTDTVASTNLSAELGDAAMAALWATHDPRAGLHVGPVALRENSHEDVKRGAKPLEVQGLAVSIAIFGGKP